MMKRYLILSAIALAGAGCGDSATAAPPLRWADFSGEWRIVADEAAPSYRNCENVNAAEGGIRIRLDANASFAVVTGSHNGGSGAENFHGSVTGSLAPPVSGTLKLNRPDGAGTLTMTSVTPTRMEGSFLAMDESFANPGSGRTPCRFDAVLMRP